MTSTLSIVLDTNQAQSWVILISAVVAGVVSIINAVKSKSNGAKLDVIHQLTNSNLTAVKADLEVARKDIGFLKEFISKNTAAPDPAAETHDFIAKIELAKPTEPETPAPVVSPFPGSPFPPPPPPKS